MVERLDATRTELPALEAAARNRLRRVIDAWLDCLTSAQLDQVRAQIERVLAGEVRS